MDNNVNIMHTAKIQTYILSVYIWILCVFAVLPALAKETFNIADYKKLPDTTYEHLDIEKIISGDRFVAAGEAIQIWGVQAPQHKEKLYKESIFALQIFTENKNMLCKYIEPGLEKSLIMHCFVNDTDLGALLVKTGWARANKEQSHTFYQKEEFFAKVGRLGIWE